MYSKIVTFNHAAVGNQGLIFSFKIQQKMFYVLQILKVKKLKKKKLEKLKTKSNKLKIKIEKIGKKKIGKIEKIE